MKLTTIANGNLSIVIIPETEMEIMILQQLARGEVSFQVHEKLQIIDKVMPNAAIISPKVSEVNQN